MVSFDEEATVLFGLRHIEQQDQSYLGGEIEDARIYDYVLTQKEICALRLNVIAGEKPWAWWDFELDENIWFCGFFQYMEKGR